MAIDREMAEDTTHSKSPQGDSGCRRISLGGISRLGGGLSRGGVSRLGSGLSRRGSGLLRGGVSRQAGAGRLSCGGGFVFFEVGKRADSIQDLFEPGFERWGQRHEGRAKGAPSSFVHGVGQDSLERRYERKRL